MAFSQGLVAGAQVGSSWINAYKQARLQSELSDAGKFTPTDVASGEDAHAAGLKAKQFQIDQISADDPEFAAKYKQVVDDHAPMLSGLEANRAKGASQMVQLPGGRRIEQDEAFSPEQMAGLRSEQSAKVYSALGHPEEAMRATLGAQGITKNRQAIDQGELSLKKAKRDDMREERESEQDRMYHELGDANTPPDVMNGNVKHLAGVIGPLLTKNNDKFKGVVYKGITDDASHIKFERDGKEEQVPLTRDMIHAGYAELVNARDPVKNAERMRKILESDRTEAGLNTRTTATLKNAKEISAADNVATVQAAGIRAAALENRSGAGGVPGLTPELNAERIRELKVIDSDPTLSSAQKDDLSNRVQMRYNAKMGQLKETTKGPELSVGDLGKIHEMVDVPVRGEDPKVGLARKRDAANRISPGAGDQLYGSAQGGASAGTSGPPAGTVKNGFVFKGGNPNDKANWAPAS